MSFTVWLLSTIAVAALAGRLLHLDWTRWCLHCVAASLLGNAFSNYIFNLYGTWSGDVPSTAALEFSLFKLLTMLAATLAILAAVKLLRIGRLR